MISHMSWSFPNKSKKLQEIQLKIQKSLQLAVQWDELQLNSVKISKNLLV